MDIGIGAVLLTASKTAAIAEVHKSGYKFTKDTNIKHNES